MYSKAKIADHPIHPMLVAFPIAFYSAACLGYFYYASGPRSYFWFELAYVANIAGVIMALVAAVPGFIDWFYGIPKDHAAKATGRLHMIMNVSALILFGLSAWLAYGQLDYAYPSSTWPALFSLLGLGLTIPSGFLGWKMIGTHHIGIEPTNEREVYESTVIFTPGLRRETSKKSAEENEKQRRSN